MTEKQIENAIENLKNGGGMRDRLARGYVEHLIKIANTSWEYRNSGQAAYDIWGDTIAEGLVPLMIEALEKFLPASE